MARLKVLNASKQDHSFSEDWFEYMDHPAVQYVIKHSKQIGYAALLLLLLILFSYRFLSSRSHQAEKDYILAKEAAQSLSDPEKLLTLQSIIGDHKDLQAKYDGLVGQTLLTQGKLQEAKPYIDRTLTRVKNEASLFDQDFAKTSLLITEGKTEEALKNAYLLKEKLLESASPPPTLYAFNLIRIAFLERNLKNSASEQKAWNELKEMASASSPVKITTFEWNRVMTHFDDQGASLRDYIK